MAARAAEATLEAMARDAAGAPEALRLGLAPLRAGAAFEHVARWCEETAADLRWRVEQLSLLDKPAAGTLTQATFAFPTAQAAGRAGGQDGAAAAHLATEAKSPGAVAIEAKELSELSEQLVERADDPAYAAALLDELGPDDLAALLDLAAAAGEPAMGALRSLYSTASRAGRLSQAEEDRYAEAARRHGRLDDLVAEGRFSDHFAATAGRALLAGAGRDRERAAAGFELLARHPGAERSFATEHPDELLDALDRGGRAGRLAAACLLALASASRTSRQAEDALEGIVAGVAAGHGLSGPGRRALAGAVALRVEAVAENLEGGGTSQAAWDPGDPGLNVPAGILDMAIDQLMAHRDTRERLVATTGRLAAGRFTDTAKGMAAILAADPGLTADEALRRAANARPLAEVGQLVRRLVAWEGPSANKARLPTLLGSAGTLALKAVPGAGAVISQGASAAADATTADRKKAAHRAAEDFGQRVNDELRRLAFIALYQQPGLRDALIDSPAPGRFGGRTGPLRVPEVDSEGWRLFDEWVTTNPRLSDAPSTIVGRADQ